MLSQTVRAPVSGERTASHSEASAHSQRLRCRATGSSAPRAAVKRSGRAGIREYVGFHSGAPLQELKSKQSTVPSKAGRSTSHVVKAEDQGMWVDGFEGRSNNKPPTPLLDTVNYPVHMNNMDAKQLKQLAKELRAEVIYDVCGTGGHLGSSLGVIELTVALHHVFDTPDDKIIWDVGHQAYPHKILTGRREDMKTLRMTDGLSPFTKRSESPHDAFGAGHSSTSISAGLGMAVGRDVKARKNHVISVIGDGAITGGMAYEAMNHAGFLDTNMIVILNDNQQVSLPTQFNNKNQEPYGALSSTLARLQSSRPLRELREVAKDVTKQLPGSVQEITAKLDEYGRGMISGTGSTLFEELGLYYIGTVDGHNLDDLVAILNEVKNTESTGPVLIHIITEKGKGYRPAEEAQDKYHGVARFDVATGKQKKGSGGVPQYYKFFADAMVAEAKADPNVVAIHAAMGGGTGLNHFEKYFPDNTFDVGIAEQHAVTFSAGLATEGLKPFCAVYSTFLQRGYDQIVHDVALQKLPVRFMIDRAGLVGADGPTHAGSFDVMYLASLPHFTVMAPCDEAELVHMIATAAAINDGPSSVRYPRGAGLGVDLQARGLVRGPVEELKGTPLPIGKGRVLREGKQVALLGFGMGSTYAMNAAELLDERGLECTVADARFAKPLDHDLIRKLAAEHEVLVTVEEGCVGGFGSHVMHFMTLDGLMDDGSIKVRSMVLPDEFIDHGNPAVQLEDAGLAPHQIAATVLKLVGKSREALELSESSK